MFAVMSEAHTKLTPSQFGIYVHVPYCRRICPYCDFNVHIAKRADFGAYAAATLAELHCRAGAFASEPVVESVYFGGGTPSLAPRPFVREILAAVGAIWPIAAGAEVTIEADPGTIDATGFAELREAGVTRVSLGWQSTHDRLLHLLGRGHTAADAHAAYAAARAAGFADLSIDLIFAVPGETLADLDADLDAVVALAPPHVSLYALTYHEGTTFQRWRERGRLVPLAEELEAEMMARIDARLTEAGYEHYEVSNYARPGWRSGHNTLYWTGRPYLGIGPGAHSFVRDGLRRGWRWESVRDPRAHAAAWREQRPSGRPAAGTPQDASVSFVEELTPRQLLAERFLVGLRLADGVDVADLQPAVPGAACPGATSEAGLEGAAGAVEAAARRAQERGWIRREGTRLVPTPAGLMNADALAVMFFC